MEGRFKEIEGGFESDSLVRKVGALFEAAKIILTLKSTLIGWLDEGFDRVNIELTRLFDKYAEQDNFFASCLVPSSLLVKSKLFGIF